MTIETQVEYRYFLTDLLSNDVISEVPFKGVSYERANRRAGAFSGSIPFIESTKGLNLYESTMPGRTGIYIMRNDVCVWGGIIWSRSYDAVSQTLSVNGAEFMSYFYHRNIWQTIQYGSDFIGVSTFAVVSGVGTIVTEFPQGFAVGQKIAVSFTNPIVDGVQTITQINSTTSFSFETTSGDGSGPSTSGAVRSLVDTYDFARDLIFQTSKDLSGFNFANEVIKPAKELQAEVISKVRSAGVVTLQTGEDHSIIAGQEIELVQIDSELDGFHIISEVSNNRTIRFLLDGPAIPLSSVPGIRTQNVESKQLLDNVATLTLDDAHNATVGQTVIVTGVDAFFTGRLDTTFNGRFTIIDIPSPNSFSFSSGGILNVGPEGVAGGIALFGSKVIYGDYGSYTANADIGIDFENLDKSGYYQDTQILRGFEQKTVGEILEQYSNTVEGGFEYRIDCDYNFDTATFSRTFRLFPISLAEAPPEGEIYPVTAFGAERLVFEYPGNILSFSVEESAEDAATRFFVVGSIEDLSDDASQPYAGAADRTMLANPNGRSWPLIDLAEQLDEIEDELSLHAYARDYLFESRPPVGVYNVVVNGSLYPQVGTFFPGQWCSIIVDDEFVRQRLASDQEPRSDILIRKIDSYSVVIPDGVPIPEEVQLRLVTDWKVDQRGN
jgi:hypothetical protein